METGLAGKRVLVTGGSGGIGSACVHAFAAEGAEVVVHYHRGRDRAGRGVADRGPPAVRVNAVAPGWTESPMTRGHVSGDQVLRISRTMALRKVARPEDVARQVVVLASDDLSGHVTGQVVTVAGGMEGRVVHEL